MICRRCKAESLELTVRQRQVEEQVIKGGSIKDVADELGMSERTVETHLKIIFRKRGVTTRLQLIAQRLSAKMTEKVTLEDFFPYEPSDIYYGRLRALVAYELRERADAAGSDRARARPFKVSASA